MKNTTIQELELSITLYDTEYEFLNVSATGYNDPLTKSLQGSPQGKTKGLVNETGITSGVALSYTVYEVESDIIDLMEKAFNESHRINVKQMGVRSREAQRGQDCIITTNPRNGTKSDGGETESVILNLEAVRNRINNDAL